MGKNHNKKSLNKEHKTVNKDHNKETMNVNDNHVNKSQNKKKEKRQLVQESLTIDDIGNSISVNKVNIKINEFAIKKVKKRKLHKSEVLTSEHSNKLVTDGDCSHLSPASSNDCPANMEAEAIKCNELNNIEPKKGKKRKLQMSTFLTCEQTKEVENDERDPGSASSKHYSTRIETKAKNKDKLKSKKERKRKHNLTEGRANEQSNKLVVDNKISLEIPVTSGEASTKKKNYFDENEATVKDEDIDKFCDEIDEEDNQQYENWIQLLEAKLHPNKKK